MIGICGCHKILIKSLYDFGGRCLKIREVCIGFEPYFKVQNLVSVHPKSIISCGGVRSNPTHTCLFRTTKSTSSNENEIKIITEKGNITGKSIFDAGTRLSKF